MRWTSDRRARGCEPHARTVHAINLSSYYATKTMRRFSDRLVSSSSTTAEQSKTFATLNVSSDETGSDSSSSNDQDYTTLVEMIGLHQTVKVLEAEYSLVTGGTGKSNKYGESTVGYTRSEARSDGSRIPTHSSLMKRASELRDILGLAKCSTLLSQVVAQHSKDAATDHSTDRTPTRSASERKSYILRPEALEWTPPTGHESPSSILKKVLQLGSNNDTSTHELGHKGLLPPFVEYAPTLPPPIAHAGTFYLPPPPMGRLDTPSDLKGDGKQFISSLAAKRDTQPPPGPQKPIAPPNKRPTPPPPPGLTLAPTQQTHSFPLNVSLLPQTFSVHLLSTLHIRFQHVAAALEALDSSFANEIVRTGGSQPPLSARWQTWMSPAGTVEMTGAIVGLKTALDELCGATARAGWIVDTWSAYQDGVLDGAKSSEAGLGSAAIDGVEIGTEAEMKKNGSQAPIGPPASGRGRKMYVQHEGVEIPERARTPTAPNGKVVPALPVTGPLRPPPGLPFPRETRRRPQSISNGDTKFPVDSPIFVPEPVSQGNEKNAKVPEKDRIISLLRRAQGAGK